MSAVEHTVTEHYGSERIADRIISRLREEGIEGSPLDPEVLAGADEFHSGGRPATELVADALEIGVGGAILDVGCGIGGAARFLARQTGATVTGIDLTPQFVEAARTLTEAVGLGGSVGFDVGSATDLPYDDATFDGVTMLHVGMNIADKGALLAELARVARPTGTIVVYDIMRVGEGEITYPVPWASDPAASFPAPPDDYEAAAAAAGLELVDSANRLELTIEVFLSTLSGPPPPIDLSHLMGPEFPTMLANFQEAMAGGVLAPIQMVFRRE